MTMIKRNSYILLLFIILTTIFPEEAICQSRSSNAGKLSNQPFGLTIEFIREPKQVKVLDNQPVFSWMLPSNAVFQKSYQILVATNKQSLNKNEPDVWDSKLVQSDRSINIVFAGKELMPNTHYFWKVRYKDSRNVLSNYSEVQEFTTGNFDKNLTTQNVFVLEKIKPNLTKKNSDGSYFIDFGKDAFATLEVNYKPIKAETLTIRLGEKLVNGKIDQNPGGLIRYQEVQLKVEPGKSKYPLSLKADERNTNAMAAKLPDSIPVIMPFRYAEIEVEGANFNPSNVIQLAYFTYFNNAASSFSSSDTILNKVWDLCKYSMKATSFAGVYVDGDRERIPYEADAYLNQLSHYSVDNEYAIARKTIEYFFESKPTWPTEWQLHVAMMMYQDYMYTGNTELIERFYERLKAKTLMALEVEDGFISTKSPNHNGALLLSLGFPDSSKFLKDIVDWPPESNNFGGKKGYQRGETDGYIFKPINTVVNGFYYHNMKIMAQFATILNKPDEAFDFEYRAARVKKSINEKLFDKEKGYYADGIGTDHGSLHANMILVAFDCVPASRLKSVMEHIKSRGMACSVYGAQYLLEALYKANEAEYALDLMTATHDRSWYNMIKIGSTITLEAWDMKYKTNADWNHAWGAAPANIIPRGMWGIQPKTPGFGIVSIKPQMAKLSANNIVVPTIRGQIKCNYKNISSSIKQYKVEIPANMVAEFELDLAPNEMLILNGSAVNSKFDSIPLNPGINKIEIKTY